MIDLKVDKIKELWKEQRGREYLIGGGSVVLVVIYLSFIIVPLFTNLAKASRQVKDLQSRISITESRIDRMDEMRKKGEVLRKKLEKHAGDLPAQKEITTLLESFASMATGANVRILSITPYGLKTAETGDTRGEYYKEMPIKITAKSGYHQLGHFISSLERGTRVIVIDDLKIQYDTNTPRLHDVVMMVKTYVAMEDEREKH
ncbi:MAG: type 4a pilus biogenesis protein PilO [Candidatus Omnitrophica bacterium]|nr:type 4a pilus biogenesis protein PilO [Candidatus Omnitrophota bacterium]